MAHDVFISYPHQEKATADAVCARLENEDIRCWIAPRDKLIIEPKPILGAASELKMNPTRLAWGAISFNSSSHGALSRCFHMLVGRDRTGRLG
jgi:hypothetical protein